MSATIKSGASSDLVTIDPVSKAMRVTIYNTAGVDQSEYTELGSTTISTFRTLGSAGVPQNIFTLENGAGSGRLVYLQGLSLATDGTAALLTVACQIDTSRTTAMPTGGTVLSKVQIDTAQASHANVVARGATASDGGAATAITATAASGYLSRRFINRQATAVGLVNGNLAGNALNLMPDGMTEADTIIIREGQAIVVQITGTAASNAATNHYIINATWHEV